MVCTPMQRPALSTLANSLQETKKANAPSQGNLLFFVFCFCFLPSSFSRKWIPYLLSLLSSFLSFLFFCLCNTGQLVSTRRIMGSHQTSSLGASLTGASCARTPSLTTQLPYSSLPAYLPWTSYSSERERGLLLLLLLLLILSKPTTPATLNPYTLKLTNSPSFLNTPMNACLFFFFNYYYYDSMNSLCDYM